MPKVKIFVILAMKVALFIHTGVIAQSVNTTINKAFFSNDDYDEFSPVYYNNGIVFCAVRTTGLSRYSTSKNEGFFNLFYVDTTGSQRSPILFSKELSSRLNDGPATFTPNGDTIYFSRNLLVDGKLKNLSTQWNKLGIFFAVLEDGKWTKIREFRYNNDWYNVTTPYISPDGQRLYFASDKPGGYGGSDLYYCEWKQSYWDNPVNLGPAINTSGNEAYPFVNSFGDLFFSSDGHPGLGGKDIFFSRMVDTTWLTPILLDPPINSTFDDFGIVSDDLMKEGYLTSNREGSYDIYHFVRDFPQIFYTEVQRENQYCFKFSDKDLIQIDTSRLEYVWTFNGVDLRNGRIINYCFPGDGNYNFRLDVIDKVTNKLFFNKSEYNIQLGDVRQAYIHAPDFAIKGSEVELDGLKSYLPGYIILDYFWDFGDGSRASGERTSHTYDAEGDYTIKLELVIKHEKTGRMNKRGVSKNIIILNNVNEIEYFLAAKPVIDAEWPDLMSYDYVNFNTAYSAEDDFQRNVLFALELMTSKNRIEPDNTVFQTLPSKYRIRERFNKNNGAYSYVVDMQFTIMATYPAFTELQKLGFHDARVKVILPEDPEEIELYGIKRNYGVCTDDYFDKDQNLTADAYIMLDQIVKLMTKYPSLRLEVGVHSDDKGSGSGILTLTQRRARIFYNYLIIRGIDETRLIGTGYGADRPVAPNLLEEDRKLNRRVEFNIID